MSTAYTNFVGPPGVGTISLPVSRLTTEQFLQIVETGVFESSEKSVELIGGIITEMAPPPGPEHDSSLMKLVRIFAPALDRFELGFHNTVAFPEGNVFLPDFALLRLRPAGYKNSHARPEDVALVVESSSSSLPKDRYLKLPVYATADIPEYWIADLDREILLVYRDPQGGTYRSDQTFSGGETVTPIACPDISIRVGDIFG
jgi:Uma2 family endonuclease